MAFPLNFKLLDFFLFSAMQQALGGMPMEVSLASLQEKAA